MSLIGWLIAGIVVMFGVALYYRSDYKYALETLLEEREEALRVKQHLADLRSNFAILNKQLDNHNVPSFRANEQMTIVERVLFLAENYLNAGKTLVTQESKKEPVVFRSLPSLLGRTIMLTEDKYSPKGLFPKGMILTIDGWFADNWGALGTFGYVASDNGSGAQVLVGWDGFRLIDGFESIKSDS